MDAYLRMNARDRRLACLAVADAKRLQAASVDKDFWVCWTLREVFNLPHIGKHLTFKGGTSLSKGWGLIERFSEDIDIVVDKDILGFTGDASPDKAPSNKQGRRRLDDLMEACRRRFPMRRFLFPHYCRNAPSGKKPCCCTKKPFARQTSRAKNAWRVTTMTHGVDDAMVALERDNPRLKGALNKNYGRADLDKHRLGELIDLIGSIDLLPSPASGRGAGGGGRGR